jgi:hypothetical protein
LGSLLLIHFIVLVVALLLVLDSLSGNILQELPLFEDELEYDDDDCRYRLDLTLHPVLRFFGYKSH